MQAGAAGFARLDRLRRKDDPAQPAPAADADSPRGAEPGRMGQTVQQVRQLLGGALQLVHDGRWAGAALQLARRLADERPYDAVIVTSPSHQAHRVGVGLSESHGVPYVADFRDPWYYGREDDLAALDPVTRRTWRRQEDRALRRMDAIVDISEGAQRAVLEDPVYPGGPERTYIRSGYVPRPDVSRPDRDHFRVVYTGWIYPFSDIDALFAACARLSERHGLGDRLQIEFMGTAQEVGGRPLAEVAAQHGLAGNFRWHPRRPQREAEALQESAAVLVAYDSVVSRALCIPSKLYHYAQAYGALLLLGDPDGAMGREAAKIGERVYAPDDAEGHDAALEAAYQQWTSRDYDAPLDADGTFDTARSAEDWDRVLRGVIGREETPVSRRSDSVPA
jgi:glycosyltransferase involved in cell wall biosynthesis